MSDASSEMSFDDEDDENESEVVPSLLLRLRV